MRRREYLKHKNNDLEELPMRLSMRNSAKYGNCNWKPWVYRSYGSKLKIWYYKITKFIKSRVGKTTTTIEERWREHCLDSRKKRCNKRPLYDAFNKYGIENFIVEELEQIENNQLSEREIYWINELQTYGSNGYNASKGRDGTVLYDHNEIIQLARLGYTKEQISKKLGCCKDSIYKVLKANGVKCRNGLAKLIALYDLAGNYIQTFWGASEALEWLIDLGITSNKRAAAHINSCILGKENQAYNYIWKALPEPI